METFYFTLTFFKIGSKTAKYIKINLTEEIHELYNKSYMTLMKETEKEK